MSRRLSVDSLRKMYFGVEADLSNRNAALDEARCSACGAEVVDQKDEVFRCCSSGHVIETTEAD